MGIRVPQYAKRNARKGLEERKDYPESQRPVLSVEEAKKKGINSGVTTARTLIRSQEISEGMAERILGYLRRNQARGERSLVARRTWGGSRDRRFEEYLKKKLGERD